ncbi:MAG: hypothetical protein ACUVXA_12370 [Candidatus Jordarchaeum sp.]|uniref:hypothetical protein n=1 Tax=Candidatus Jordarchaeum sp. TaxID=2823881 RepID=UPI004049317B
MKRLRQAKLMYFYIGIFSLLAIIVTSFFSNSYKKPFLVLILLSPVVASSWRYQFYGISLIDIYFVLFIFILFIRILIRKERLYEFPYKNIFFVYMLALIFVTIQIFIVSGTYASVEFLAKSLFFPVCFYLCFIYFADRKDFKNLLIVFISAAIVPLVFIFFQKITGYTWRYHETRGILRSQGAFHSIITPRIIIMQALIGIFLYWHYFLEKGRRSHFTKTLLLFLSSLCLLGLYFLYSKTIVVTLIIWILLISFFKRKIILLPLAIFLIIFVNAIFENKIVNDLGTIFSKEIDYSRGKIESDYILAGRGKIWRNYIEEFKSLPILKKILGTGRSHGYFHNDLLRIIFTGGILTLFLYATLIFILTSQIIRMAINEKKTFFFAIVMAICYYFIESMGQVVGLYPIVYPFTWGLVGLSMNKRLSLNH